MINDFLSIFNFFLQNRSKIIIYRQIVDKIDMMESNYTLILQKFAFRSANLINLSDPARQIYLV